MSFNQPIILNITITKSDILHNKIIHLCALGIILLICRVLITGSTDFLFMLWNLFLASIPLFLSRQLRFNASKKTSKFFCYILLFFWVLFLPNSPYLITDFIHLETGEPTIWIDLLILFVFALSGLLLGVLSMIDVFGYLQQGNNPKLANAILLGISFLSGFGIFLGRFLRFNSWDIIARPLLLFECLYKSLFMWNAWLWIFGFGSFIWISFWTLKPFLRGENR